MKQIQNLYDYLYQTLTLQLQSGTFLFGQKFPSQREICLQYNVGITTARKVVKMLEQQGYIQTAQGKPSVVTYQAAREARALYLVQRQEEIADAYRGLGLLMPVLYREGAKRCKEPELCFLREIRGNLSEQMEPADHYRIANAFFTALLRPLKNKLIIDLELDSENYLHVPYIPFPGAEDPFATTAERTKTWFESAMRQIEQKRYDEFCGSAALLYRESCERVDRYLSALGRFTPPAAQVKERYHWFRIKDRCELYSRLAMTIIRRIIAGEFDEKKYLPSIPMLMEEYGVMKNTACRAVALLNSLGFAQTIDKKGTILSMNQNPRPEENFSFAEPVIRERMSLFLDALQIVSLTSYSCAASVSSVPRELASSFEKRLFTTPDDKFISFSFQLLMNSFIQLMPYHSLKNIFQQLNDLIIWGHYLQTVAASYYLDYRKISAAMSAVAAALKSRNSDGLPEAFSSAFTMYYQDVCGIVSHLPYDFKSGFDS